jgi:hypothetical protein
MADETLVLDPEPATGPLAVPASPEITPTAASPGVGRPPRAVRVSTFPADLADPVRNVPVQAEQVLIGAETPRAAAGTLRVTALLAAGAATSTISVSLDGGQTWGTLNGGTALSAGAWYVLTLPVHRGDVIQVRVDSATQVAYLAADVTDSTA